MIATMRRREFITLLGGAAAVWPLPARAQIAERTRRIGVLMGNAESDPESAPRVTAFERGLIDLGWMSGRNVLIDYRWGAGEPALMQALAKELVGLQPEVLVASTTPVVVALTRETGTIPIVFVVVSDPIGSGFIESLARPGGNMTVFINIESSLGGKWLELLKEVAPRINRATILFNPATATYADYYLTPFKAAAASLAVKAIAAPVHETSELEAVVAAQARDPNTGLIVMSDSFMSGHGKEITSLAARYRLPTVYPFRFFTELGGLLSYGSNRLDQFRRAASYIDRILKGEKPSELPVQAPVKFELVINLKTAKTLGLDVPFLLQQRADEVIE